MTMTALFKFPHTPHLAWLGHGEPRGDKVLSSEERDSFLSAEIIKVASEQLLEAVRAISEANGGEGASQTDLAERLGVTSQVIARVSKGPLEQGRLELVSKRPKVFRAVDE